MVYIHRTALGYGELHLLALAKGLFAAGEPKRLTSAALRAEYATLHRDLLRTVREDAVCGRLMTVPGVGL